MTFNLDPLPGFRGLEPHRPVTIYTRNLPHWRQQGATYFVTFHLADALPDAKRNEFASMRREWDLRDPPPRSEATWTEYAKTVFQKVEKWMDAGHGDCWFRQPQYAAELRRAILHFHHIGANPRRAGIAREARAGIAREAWDRWINPHWQVHGWDFHDE